MGLLVNFNTVTNMSA